MRPEHKVLVGTQIIRDKKNEQEPGCFPNHSFLLALLQFLHGWTVFAH